MTHDHDSRAADADCLFTLVLPAALEEDVLDILLAHPQWVSGFSVLQGHGMGADARLVSAMEQVQGRARRVLVQATMRQHDVPALLQALRAQMASPEVAYWATPLLCSGRLG